MEADLIVNVQGDEPLLQPQTIDLAVRPLLADERIPMGTLKARITIDQDMTNPNVVKVVTDTRGRALYFSRSAIPFFRSRTAGAAMYRHIGLYVYRRDFLLHLTGLPQSELEKAESLEQLRALENGFTIHVAETDYEPIGVDAPEDIATVESFLHQQAMA
jgi:3-deoxy-manno-octulosonate cytidylyltransferase (CMP-KDO synthetase)